MINGCICTVKILRETIAFFFLMCKLQRMHVSLLLCFEAVSILEIAAKIGYC